MNISDLCTSHSNIILPPIPPKTKKSLDLTKLVEKCTRLCDTLAQHTHWGTQKEIMIDSVSQEAKELLGALVSIQHQPTHKRRRITTNQQVQGNQRCHSCHTSETPEWRRGPDGARTLCNACGLHYSKLLRRDSLIL